MTAGSTTGAVNLGDGNNRVMLSGGVVGQGIATGNGTDTFIWRGGTITGAVTLGLGNDTATLQGLSDSNLAKLTSLDGGQGFDVLTLSTSQTGGSSRFVNWETVNLANSSQLTLDKAGLTLGDSGTATGRHPEHRFDEHAVRGRPWRPADLPSGGGTARYRQ
jgi:hypothetical protein